MKSEECSGWMKKFELGKKCALEKMMNDTIQSIRKRTLAARVCVHHRNRDCVFFGQQWNLHFLHFPLLPLTEIQGSPHCLANVDRRKNPSPNFELDFGLSPIYCFLRSSFGSTIPARIHRNSWLQTNTVFYRCRWKGLMSLNISTITWPCHYTIQMTNVNTSNG